MGYSVDVNAGDTILAAHHNNLRREVREAICDTVTRYLSIHPADFIISDSARTYAFGDSGGLRPQDLFSTRFIMPVHLPHNAIVTSLKAYWYREDEFASGELLLRRWANSGGGSPEELASANSDVFTGDHTVEDTSINYATIDNLQYKYGVILNLDANDSYAPPATDVYFNGAVITYSVSSMLP